MLQAAPLSELTASGIAVAVTIVPATLHSLFANIDAEPQCRRLARLLAVPALQPLLLANGAVQALLAGARCLLVRTGARHTRMHASCGCQQCNTTSLTILQPTTVLLHSTKMFFFISASICMPPCPGYTCAGGE